MNKPKPIQILLIEDNRADAVLLRDMLEAVEPDRFELVCDDRLSKALARLRERTFDVMLLDLNLPDSRGLETLATLHAAAERIPIVVVTGAEDENLAIQAIRQGAQDYLLKGSLSAKGIARVIQYAVDRKRVEESLREAQRRELEFKAAAEAARTARDTINAMSEGVLLMDMQGRITSINPAMERLSGFPAAAVLGRPLKEFIPRLVAEGEAQVLAEALESVTQANLPSLEPFTIRPVSGAGIPVIPAVAFIRGLTGEAVSIVVTLRDISALTAAREALAASEREYRELVESANSIIMRRRKDGTITFANKFAQKFFGFREEELVGHNVVDTIVPAVETSGRDLAAMIRNIGENPEIYSTNENENSCKDGRRVWVQWTNRMLSNANGKEGEILCVGVDATARKSAEAASLHYQQRLRSLANRLASTEEEERRRVSRYIHDTVIQSLALANIKLGSLKKEAGKTVPAEEMKKLDTARELINEGIGECRQLMSDLTPAMLYELGLEHALEDLVEKLAKQHDVDIRLVQEGEPRPMEIALRGLLFQSTRELIVNALKHAGASCIRVTTGMADNHVRICVKDNGAGLDSSSARAARLKGSGGFGLFNLRERVEGLGGRFDIASEPGSGTTAVIVVPLAGKTPLAG